MPNILLAPKGKYRVIGVDTFSNEDCIIDDIEGKEEAIAIAETKGKDMYKNICL